MLVEKMLKCNVKKIDCMGTLESPSFNKREHGWKKHQGVIKGRRALTLIISYRLKHHSESHPPEIRDVFYLLPL